MSSAIYETIAYFMLVFILLPFSTSSDTCLMINTIEAISKTYHFQYFLFLSSREMAQTLHHENLLKALHSRITSSTIVNIHIDQPDKVDQRAKNFKTNSESRSLVIFNGDDSIERIKFVKFSENVNFGSSLIWLIFFNDTNQVEEFAKLLVLPFNSQVILAVLDGSEYVYFKAPYRVAKNFPLRITNVGNFSVTDGLDLTVIDVALTRMDMEGVHLKAGTVNYPPASTVIYVKNGKLSAAGFLPDVWEVLKERLNFTYDYYLSEDNSAGAMLLNGTWSGLMGMLINKKIDVAVTHLSITKRRMKYVDFAVPIIFTRKRIFYLDVDNQFEWGNLFRPFSIGVWFGILSWFVVISISLAYFFKTECSKNKMEHASLRNCECTILGFSVALRAITNQGSDVMPQSLSSRIVFFSAYLTMVVVLPSYSAALISYLTIQTPYKPFDSIRSMAEKGTHYLVIPLYTSDYSYFAESTDPILQNVLEKLIIPFKERGPNPKNNKEGIDLVCHDKSVALFGDSLQGEFHSDVVFKKHGCKIASLETAVISAGESFAFQKGSPYARIFNSELRKIVYSGLLERLQNQVYLKIQQQNFDVSGYEEINLRHVTQIYSLFFGGFILAVIILAFEVLSDQRKKIKTTDKKVKHCRKASKKRMKLKFVTRKVKSKKLIRKLK